MNEMTEAISEIKAKVSIEEWKKRILECQQSGMSVRAWGMKNGITTGAYHFHPRKMRESVLTENRIVPLSQPKSSVSSEIKIESADISISLPESASVEQLSAIIKSLKSC